MDTKDIKKITEGYSEKIESIKVLINTYKVELKGNAPNPLMVQIWKDEYDIYTHSMSYYISSKNRGDDIYKSIENCKSEEEALRDAVVDSLMNYDPNTESKDQMIEENEHFIDYGLLNTKESKLSEQDKLSKEIQPDKNDFEQLKK